jgi:hypothetical protein
MVKIRGWFKGGAFKSRKKGIASILAFKNPFERGTGRNKVIYMRIQLKKSPVTRNVACTLLKAGQGVCHGWCHRRVPAMTLFFCVRAPEKMPTCGRCGMTKRTDYV